MSKWLDLKGPIVADTVYDDGQLVARDVSYTIPGLELVTADLQAMGTISVPLVGLFNNMELAITKIGVDLGLRRMNRLEKHNLEFRWVQNILKSDGAQTTEGCKAFIRSFPSALPEIGVEIGSSTEAELIHIVSRMQIYIGGEEYICVDRLSQILRISGKDYMSSIRNLL